MLTDVKVKDISIEYEEFEYRTPFKFGASIATHCVYSTCTVVLEDGGGKTASGTGALPMGTSWGWPSKKMDLKARREPLLEVQSEFGKRMLEAGVSGHPMDIAHEVKPVIEELRGAANDREKPVDPMPELAAIMACSPWDAAVHDAYGRLHGVSTFATYNQEFMPSDLSKYMGGEFKGKYPCDFLLGEIKPEIAILHLLGGLDKLTEDELTGDDPDDGLPVSLDQYIRRDGIFCVKVKIRGNDLEWDVERMAGAYELLMQNKDQIGSPDVVLTCDANEQVPSVEHAVEMVERLQVRSPEAYDHLAYVEQPTSRDLEKSMDMRPLAKYKPVVADECLTDLASLERAIELGWTGAALKCCKGHSEVLLMIARCETDAIPYTLMDLTAPDIAFAQAAGIVARCNMISNMAESNSRQFMPQANERLAGKLPELFKLVGGRVKTAALAAPGLGY